MKKLEYTVRFNTPAFLGNAEQQAQWRTPPFKALIRQWWRVVKAKEVGYDHKRLLLEENRLFGAAADDGGGSHRSLVRFRLSAWNEGTLKQWPNNDDRLQHPEVKNREGRLMPVGAQLYLGYGPLTYRQGGTALNNDPPRSAITDGQDQTLRLMLPEAHIEEIQTAMQLATWFGTLGSRSRNGWGALHIEGNGIEALTAASLKPYLRPLNDCLQLDWPHAIGSDAKGALVWQTEAKSTWREVMKELARIKIAFRTQPKLSLHGVGPGTFAKRHLLAYPVTHHNVGGWGNQGRLANQIRFKVMKNENSWRGVIVHLPCCLPTEMALSLPPMQRNNLDSLSRETWQAVHSVLDQNAQRIS